MRSVSPSGFIKLHDDRDYGRDFNDVLPYLGLNNQHSFRETKQLNFQSMPGVIGKYHQQYYRNIEVDGGHYISTGGPDGPGNPFDPCQEVNNFISTNIFSSIEIDVNPVVSESELLDILMVDGESDSKLLILPNFNKGCDYRLVWSTNFVHEDNLINAVVDAVNGGIIKRESLGHFNDNLNETYFRKKNNSKKRQTSCWGTNFFIMDGTGTFCGANQTAYDASLLPELCPGDNAVADAFFADMVKTLGAIESLHGGQFIDEDFYIILGCAPLTTPGSPITGIGTSVIADYKGFLWLDFSQPTFFLNINVADLTPGGTSLDILYHELEHMFIVESRFAYPDFIEEALADIVGTYLESLCQPTGHDWILGDDFGGSIRDFENPSIGCFEDAILMSADPHVWAESFNHLFYLLTDGSEALGIDALGLTPAFNLIDAALRMHFSNEPINNFYFDLLDLAQIRFNTTDLCDSRIQSILRALNEVCIGPGNSPNCSFAINGPIEVCEEDGRFCLNLTGPAISSGANFNWQYPPTWTSDLEDNPYTQGTSICIEFHDFQYYPQTFEICARTSNSSLLLQDRKKCVKIKIKDCDGDDPSCEDYFGTGNFDNQVIVERSILAASKDALKDEIIIYNISGQVLYSGNIANFYELEYVGQLIFIKRFYENGATQTMKKFILQ